MKIIRLLLVLLYLILYSNLSNAINPNLNINISIIGYDTNVKCFPEIIDTVYLLQIDILNNTDKNISIGYYTCDWMRQFKFISGNVATCDWGGCDSNYPTSATIKPKMKHTFKIFVRPISKRTKEIQIQYKYISGDEFTYHMSRKELHDLGEANNKGVKLKARPDPKPIYYNSNFCKLESKERIPFSLKEVLNK